MAESWMNEWMDGTEILIRYPHADEAGAALLRFERSIQFMVLC